jgi:hypothetical protein
MTIASPLRLDRLQTSIVAVLDDALGSTVEVGWAYGEALWNENFTSGNAVNLTMVNGPSFHNQNLAHGSTPFFPPTVVTNTVDTATVDHRYRLVINNFTYFYDGVVLDTVDTIRAALVALVVADSESPYTAAATVNAGEYTVTPDATGSIWQMSIDTLQTGVPTLNTQAVVKTQDTRRFTIALGCFSKGRSPRTGAWDIVAKCQAALTSPEYAETFARYGVGVWGKGPAVDLSDLAGGHWESRVSFDVDFAMKSTFTTNVEQIDTLHVGLIFSDPDITESFTIT